MRNRAKCKLCNSIIESFHKFDYVECECGQIAVFEGDAMRCAATDYANFLRIDDNGNEIVVKYESEQAKEATDNRPADPPKQVTKEELINMLDTMIKNIENLPQHVIELPVNHYDLVSFMICISNILKKG